jgi:hypothetical protein
MCSLDSLVAAAVATRGVRVEDLEPGDRVIVRTRNSVYSLLLKGEGTFEASGGWFAREDREASEVQVAGCTWGGSAILTRMIAAPGMFLEFANHVRTTRICEVRLLKPAIASTLH